MSVIDYLANNIFKQPSLFMGFIACIGLVLQKKDFSQVIKGTFKTIIGVIVLFIGVNLIGTAVAPLSAAFSTLYALPESNQFDGGRAWLLLGEYGSVIGMVMVIAFVINLVVAKFTPFKSVFLTGHIFFWMAYIFVLAGVEGGLSGLGLIVFATVFLSLYIVLVPWLSKPVVKSITGSDAFTIGHTASLYLLLGHFIGKIIGDPKHSTEDLKLPKQLNMFKDTVIATSLIMFLVYIITGLIIGKEGRMDVYAPAVSAINTIGGMHYDLFTFSLMSGLTFGAGLMILLTGVRLMLGELIPAFKGISDKLIPDAIPALDVPMLFSFGGNALMIGFVLSMVTSMATLLILARMGWLSYAVIPIVTACFYDVAPGAIAANAKGGRLAAVVTGVVGGIVLVVLTAGSLAVLFNTAAGFVQLYGGNDFSLWGVISGWIASLLA